MAISSDHVALKNKLYNKFKAIKKIKLKLKIENIDVDCYPMREMSSGRDMEFAWIIILISKRISRGNSVWFRLYFTTLKMLSVFNVGAKSSTCVSL